MLFGHAAFACCLLFYGVSLVFTRYRSNLRGKCVLGLHMTSLTASYGFQRLILPSLRQVFHIVGTGCSGGADLDENRPAYTMVFIRSNPGRQLKALDYLPTGSQTLACKFIPLHLYGDPLLNIHAALSSRRRFNSRTMLHDLKLDPFLFFATKYQSESGAH